MSEQVEEVAERARVGLLLRDPLVEGVRQRRVDAEEAAEADLDRDGFRRRCGWADVPDVGGREDARRVRAHADGLLSGLLPPDRVRPATRRRQQADGLEEPVPVPLPHEAVQGLVRVRLGGAAEAVGVGAARGHTRGRWPRSGVHAIVRPEGVLSIVRWTNALIVA